MINVPLRAHVGSISGRISPEYPMLFPHDWAFELGFGIHRGMSGAPLVRRGVLPWELFGVCRGNTESEVKYETIVGDGGITTERLRVEQFGIATDIRPLLNTWQLPFRGNQTLRACVTPTQFPQKQT